MKKTTFLILVILILIVTVINLVLYSKVMPKKSKNVVANTFENSDSSATSEETKSEEEQELEKLQKMTERDRMEYYFSKFIKYIKNEEYTNAYNLLYPEFRQNYFKTQEEFKSYVQKTYPSSVGFSYNDIERQGSIYVLIIKVIDTNKKVGEEKTQRIVIQENDFNDFVLSFQVI